MKTKEDQRRFKPIADCGGEMYDFYTIAIPNRLGNRESADWKQMLLTEMCLLGQTSRNFTFVGDEDDQEIVVDADALDEHYKDMTDEQFGKAHINAALKAPEDRDEFEKALIKPRITPSLSKIRSDREKYKRAMQSCVFFIEGDARLLGMFRSGWVG